MVDTREPKVSIRDLSIFYGGKAALENVSFDVFPNEIFGIIGPANSGKTSLLRVLNRMDVFNAGGVVGQHYASASTTWPEGP